MTQKGKQPTLKSKPPLPIVVFGIDADGHPKAARFLEKQASIAAKAAEQLRLRVLTVTGPALTEVAARLPAGRIHANGRGLVPSIRRDLYAKLIAAAGTSAGSGGTAAGSGVSPGKPSDGDGGKDERRPAHWDDIGKGDLVLAQESLEDGWYEAIVVEKNGDVLSLRWRDFPRERGVSRHRLSVALVYPDQQAATGGKTQPAKAASKGAMSGSGDPPFPKTWDEIGVDQLVLAKQDGPWGTWFEAIPIESQGDKLTLRWRDYPRIPLVVRPRLGLALLYPKA
jgi:hypothetical protein